MRVRTIWAILKNAPPPVSVRGDIQGDWYIDPENGDDKVGDGSKEKPFRTFAQLRKELGR